MFHISVCALAFISPVRRNIIKYTFTKKCRTFEKSLLPLYDLSAEIEISKLVVKEFAWQKEGFIEFSCIRIIFSDFYRQLHAKKH